MQIRVFWDSAAPSRQANLRIFSNGEACWPVRLSGNLLSFCLTVCFVYLFARLTRGSNFGGRQLSLKEDTDGRWRARGRLVAICKPMKISTPCFHSVWKFFLQHAQQMPRTGLTIRLFPPHLTKQSILQFLTMLSLYHNDHADAYLAYTRRYLINKDFSIAQAKKSKKAPKKRIET